MRYSTAFDRFQSTHPSGVRLEQCEDLFHGLGISIHAPQWGATRGIGRCRGRRGYFNPRTPVGCDLTGITVNATISKFQSTHPSGVRHAGAELHVIIRDISIHAPQWGATQSEGLRKLAAANFNPRTPVGCDSAIGVEGSAPLPISIHAPQWGATSPAPPSSRRTRDFNPRTPVGCDNTAGGKATQALISIHAPQWGATRW